MRSGRGLLAAATWAQGDEHPLPQPRRLLQEFLLGYILALHTVHGYQLARLDMADVALLVVF